MRSPFLLLVLPAALALVSCGGRELSASIAIPVSEPGKAFSAGPSHAPTPALTGGAIPFRVPSATDRLPQAAESHPAP